MTDEFRVAYNPVPTAGRVAELSARLKRSVLNGLLSLAFWLVVFFWQRDRSPGVAWGILVVGLLVSLALFAGTAAAWVLARRDLAGVGTGDAMVVDREGITGIPAGGEPVRIPWEEVAGVLGRGRSLGRGPNLVVTRHDGPAWSVPLSFLDAQAGTIDNAIRVFSGGRKGVDLSELSL
ncbi:MAG TPA: hypothetical protein VHO26_04200 [Propionibacteriaceae bacterium]|nr:hypothetical protein [Propionibacteriaceae bacterium]